MKLLLKIALSFVIVIILGSCHEENVVSKASSESRSVVLKNTEEYALDLLVSGDEEGALIKTQAKSFQISELFRDSSTSWRVVYRYRPIANFTGTDYVEIETCTGGEGVGCNDIKVVSINFTITN